MDSCPFSLQDLPQELLDEVAFHVACGDSHSGGVSASLSPIASLLPLLQCSREFHRKLSKSDPLFARIFRHEFSYAAVERRAFTPTARNYAEQLRVYTRVLAAIKQRRTFDDPLGDWDVDVDEILHSVLFMLLDDDGKNRSHLDRVNAYEWVKGIVVQLVRDRTVNGYPEECATTAFATEVLWLMTTRERLDAESEGESAYMTHVMLPFVTLSFRVRLCYFYPLRTLTIRRFCSMLLHIYLPTTSTSPFAPTHMSTKIITLYTNFRSRAYTVPIQSTVPSPLTSFTSAAVSPSKLHSSPSQQNSSTSHGSRDGSTLFPLTLPAIGRNPSLEPRTG
jgi:hypothetical protein